MCIVKKSGGENVVSLEPTVVVWWCGHIQPQTGMVSDVWRARSWVHVSRRKRLRYCIERSTMECSVHDFDENNVSLHECGDDSACSGLHVWLNLWFNFMVFFLRLRFFWSDNSIDVPVYCESRWMLCCPPSSEIAIKRAWSVWQKVQNRLFYLPYRFVGLNLNELALVSHFPF